MTLVNLTERSAVLQAIQEYDQIGRRAFLERYGFGKAKGWIEQEGRYYESKALAAAAHWYQHGQTLAASDFPGGATAVPKKLESLGFAVVDASTAAEAGLAARKPGAFVLLWNPDLWAWPSEERHRMQEQIQLQGNAFGSWSTGARHEGIELDDRIFLVRVGEAGSGIVASGTATSAIFELPAWAGDGSMVPYVDVAWERLDVSGEDLPLGRLAEQRPGSPEDSEDGARLSDEVAAIWETLWAAHAAGLDEAPAPGLPQPRLREALAGQRLQQRKFRNLLLAHQPNLCAACGFDVLDVLEPSHIVPESQGGPSTLENGRLLCANHHRALQAGLLSFDGEQPVWAAGTTPFGRAAFGPAAPYAQVPAYAAELLAGV